MLVLAVRLICLFSIFCSVICLRDCTVVVQCSFVCLTCCKLCCICDEFVHGTILKSICDCFVYSFEKCFVSFPKGTKVNGIDVSGFSTDVFLSDYMKKDMLEKGRATVSFKKDEPVPIWTGKKDDAEHPYQRYEVKATDLTHALKVAQDSYKAEKAAERAAAKDGVSLAGEARDMETGKDALAGDDPAKSTKSRTGQDIAQ